MCQSPTETSKIYTGSERLALARSTPLEGELTEPVLEIQEIPMNLDLSRCQAAQSPSPRSVPVAGRVASRAANERGAVLYLMAAMMVVFLGIAALAVDMGMWAVARSEAQRMAESGAHAGASILLYAPNDEPGARLEAETFAEMNTVRGITPDVLPIDDIDVLLDSSKVRVRVHRDRGRGNPVGTFFAKAMGITEVDVNAVAAAQVWPANGTDCVLPFAIPDLWRIPEDGPDRILDPAGSGDYYPAINDVWDPGRGDYYIPATDGGNYTGYGMDKIGRLTKLTTSIPSESPQEGFYYSIRLPGMTGGNDYRQAIQDCWDPPWGDVEFEIGDEVIKEPGNMIGPTQQGFLDILNDPNEQGIVWNDAMGCPVRDGACVGAESRRVRPLILFDPTDWLIIDNGAMPIEISGFGGIFIDSYEAPGTIWVRWMEFATIAPASEWGENSEGLLRVLRIVE
jgi:hypothetical protein